MNAVSAVKTFIRNHKNTLLYTDFIVFMQKMKILSEKGDKI